MMHPHIEKNVHQAAVQKTRRHQPPRLLNVVRQRQRRAHAHQNLAINSADAEKSAATPSTHSHRQQQADSVEQAAHAEHHISDRRLRRQHPAQPARHSRGGKSQARSALVAFRSGGSGQRAACGAQSRPHIRWLGGIAAAERALNSFDPSLDFPAPAKWKLQCVSLRAKIRVPIIAEIAAHRVGAPAKRRRSGGEPMKDFEEFGQWLDKEIEHVKHVVETEIRPTAEKKLAAALRAASEKLGEFAKEIESRRTPGPTA